MKRMLIVLLGAAVIAGVEARGAQGEDLKLWYGAPAAKWTEALPLGNGRLGAMVFGGVRRERIQCNEISLWSGWPERENDRVGSYEALVKVRQLLREGHRDEAGKVAVKEFLSEKDYGKPDFGAYQSFCDVLLDFEGLPEKVEDYRRDLDLATAAARVAFRSEGIAFQREYFCSFPDQVTVMRFTSSGQGKISLRIGLAALHADHSVTATGNEITLAGQVDTKSPEHEGLRFEARVQVRAEGGTIAAEGQQIVVKNADAVTMMMVGATNYRLKYPDYRGTDPARANTQTLQALAKKSWVELREAHGADFQRLNRALHRNGCGPRRSTRPDRARKSLAERGVAHS